MTRLRWIINGGILAGLIGLSLVVWGLFGDVPRMLEQPKLRAFDAKMPLPPEGAVPVETPAPVTFVKGDAENLARGKVYYGYYCMQCHSEKGDGRGPVGESYHPAPPDLGSQKIQAYSDEQMANAIFNGAGHQLENNGFHVLRDTVPPQHVGYIVAYVRAFVAKK